MSEPDDPIEQEHDLDRSDLKGMSPAEVLAAHEAGRLDTLIRAHADPAPTLDEAMSAFRSGTITPADAKTLQKHGRADLVLSAQRIVKTKENNQ